VNEGVFEVGDLPLELGGVLEGARIDYRVYGHPGPSRDNLVLFPHMYSGGVGSVDDYIGEGRALDPAHHCVIVPGQLGNGTSSSPSNTSSFPEVTVGDDITAQARLLEEVAGNSPLELVVGYSMGANQGYEWAVRQPDRVRRLLAIAGTARAPEAARALIDRLLAALESAQPLERHAELWAELGVSADAYAEESWRDRGFESEEQFRRVVFREDFDGLHPSDLSCQLRKWRDADASRSAGGDLAQALGRIAATVCAMPFSGDPFATAEDCAAEAALISDCTMRPVQTAWGHYAFGFDPGAQSQVELAIADLLSTTDGGG
jgi:homoserine O-acetyltransferase/O-succinyltransferase